MEMRKNALTSPNFKIALFDIFFYLYQSVKKIAEKRKI